MYLPIPFEIGEGSFSSEPLREGGHGRKQALAPVIPGQKRTAQIPVPFAQAPDSSEQIGKVLAGDPAVNDGFEPDGDLPGLKAIYRLGGMRAQRQKHRPDLGRQRCRPAKRERRSQERGDFLIVRVLVSVNRFHGI
jgi:hypothetical protein